jgi:hypothetical protein
MSETTRNIGPRTMRRGSHALTGIRFDPNDEAAEAAAARALEEETRAATAAAEAAKEKMFTPEQQAAVDRIVQERVARVKAAPPADYEELKAAKARLDAIEAENATELEKATKRAEEAEQQAATALAQAKETRLQSAILAEAAKPDRKIIDPDAVLQLLDRAALELDADGAPKNIAEAMDALLTAKPYLAGGGNGRVNGGADQGARGNGGENQLASTEGMTAEQIAEAVREGRFDSYLASKT